MGNMRFKVGDRVRIKSIDWYKQMLSIPNKLVWQNKLTNDFVGIWCGSHIFKESMFWFLGKIMTIQEVGIDFYLMEEDTCGYEFTDEMIEGAVEPELTAPTIMDDSIFLNKWFKVEQDIVCPEDYEFFDEMGNIIKTQRVFIRKKKKEYPKTYEECCRVLGYSGNYNMILTTDVDNKLFNALYRLKVCRDAYWKLYGEEMGLGKPWEPTMETVYCISRNDNVMKCSYRGGKSNIFEFPTEEMRDAFYENFEELIESVKELL